MYLLLAIPLIQILFPLYWMIATSLQPVQTVTSTPVQYVPTQFTLDAYLNVFFQTSIPKYYFNSIFISAGVVTLTTVAATFGGYGLTRLNISYKETFAKSILFGYMFPPILLSIPMYIFWREFGILNTYLGLILAETAVALPFALWLMWQFFQTVPMELEESAKMAGASRFRAFYEVALPVAKPGMIAISVFAYQVSWNAFTIPKVLMQEEARWPLTVGLYTLTQSHFIFWNQMMAASTLIILPSFVFVYYLQRHILQGFKISA
jgi:multiple sugar transport system permease protein